MEQPENNFSDELNRIRDVYSKRKGIHADYYNILEPAVYMNFQERERSFIKWLNFAGFGNVKMLKLLEIGSGYGDNLLEFIKLGFLPENLAGNDIMEDRIAASKKKLPESVKIFSGDASALNLRVENYDIVFQSMVFSSIFNLDLQKKLAKKMWSLVKPGGGILSYDFVYNNPNNKDVMRVTKKKILALFDAEDVKTWRITLAPSVARSVTKLSPKFYTLLNIFPFMRTHLLCWIKKSLDS